MSWFARLSFLIALGAGIGAAVLAVRDEPPSALSLTISGAEQDLGLTKKAHQTITVRITNSGPDPRSVVGTPKGCGDNCCLEVAVPGRITVPPGQSVDVSWDLTIQSPGPFSVHASVYLDDTGLRFATVSVSGTLSTAEGPTNAKLGQ
jgi:hypothetical protein